MDRAIGFLILHLKTLKDEKIAVVWSLFIPLLLSFTFRQSYLIEPPSREEALFYLSCFWAYIIYGSYLNGVGVTLARYREYGYMKTYILLSGGKWPVMVGLALSRVALALVSLLIFTLVMSFFYHLNVALFLTNSLIGFLFISPPLLCLVLVIPILPFNLPNLVTILNILFFPLTYLAFNRPVTNHYMIEFLFMLNPLDYALHAYLFLDHLLFQGMFPASPYILGIITMIYMILGLCCVKKVNIASRTLRT